MQQKENDRIHLLNNVIDAAKDVGVKFFLYCCYIARKKIRGTKYGTL
jgi:hypothetical protein